MTTINGTKPAEPRIIAINETYGFTLSDREYSVYKRVTVDPTKAPSYKSEEGVSPPQPYDAWRPINRYYPVTAEGMRAMLSYVAIRTVGETFEGMSVAGYLIAVQAELSRLNTLISSAMIPPAATE